MEELEDNINTLEEWKNYNKYFVSKLKGEYKEKAREDSELKNFWTNLNDGQRKTTISFLSKQTRYTSSYEDLKYDILNLSFVDYQQALTDINNTDGANVVYSDDNIIVAEIWTQKASVALGSKSWCISGHGGVRWGQYNSPSLSNKQYFIWNFNAPEGNEERMVGVTIREDGSEKEFGLSDNEPHGQNLKIYCDNNNIPLSIFRGIDYKKEHENIVKYWGLNDKTVISRLKESGLLDIYQDMLSPNYKAAYGYSVEGLSELKRKILSGKFYDLVEELEDSEETPNWVENLDFIDKVIIANPYIISKYTLRELFSVEIDSGVVSSIDEYSITLDIPEEEYAWDILNLDHEYYLYLKYGEEFISNDYTREENDFCIRYIDEDNYNKILEIHKLLKKIQPKVYTDIESDDNILNIIRKSEFESVIEDFYTELVYEAKNFADADSRTFDELQLGQYYSRSLRQEENGWNISFSDLVENFNKNGIIDGSLEDYIKSSPNDMSGVNFLARDEYPSIYSYNIEGKDANRILMNFLDDYLDNLKDNSDFIIGKIETLKNSGFKLSEIEDKFWWILKLDDEYYGIENDDIDTDEEQNITYYIIKELENINDRWKTIRKKGILKSTPNGKIDNIKDPNQLELQLERKMKNIKLYDSFMSERDKKNKI
jgi:hypothetical protein